MVGRQVEVEDAQGRVHVRPLGLISLEGESTHAGSLVRAAQWTRRRRRSFEVLVRKSSTGVLNCD